MSTEYRRGIPSTAHVEAATRLGLLWHSEDGWFHHFRFKSKRYRGMVSVSIEDTHEDWVQPDVDIRGLLTAPSAPDGTPVDWEVLDQEVARVGQGAGNRNANASGSADDAAAGPGGFVAADL